MKASYFKVTGGSMAEGLCLHIEFRRFKALEPKTYFLEITDAGYVLTKSRGAMRMPWTWTAAAIAAAVRDGHITLERKYR